MATMADAVEAAIMAARKALKEGREATRIAIPVRGSKALGKASWDPLSWDLDIVFRGKTEYGVYTYPGVPVGTVLELARAGSKGRVFHSRIKLTKGNKRRGRRGLGEFGL
jgi:hypothetical protein